MVDERVPVCRGINTRQRGAGLVRAAQLTSGRRILAANKSRRLTTPQTVPPGSASQAVTGWRRWQYRASPVTLRLRA
jgi:hypothetical protein